MNCPECNSEHTHKVIAAAMPMKICNDCYTLWGEPFATIYTLLVAPLEGFFNGGYAFSIYEGSYFTALWEYLKGDWIE